MTVKAIVAKTWTILPSFDGLLYSQYPLGDKPVPTPAGGPKIAFTDRVSGPTSGGEFNRGAYLSIFGWGFGLQSALGTAAGARVFIGGVEVDNYRALNPAPTFSRNGLQRIIVQVGPIGAAAAGSVNAIKVTVNGVDSNTDKTFTVQTGDTYFVALTGNDSTGVKNDITKPYRYAQQANGGSTFTGIWATLQAGDDVVMRGGTWSDQVGFDARFWRFRTQSGSAPTGIVGHGYIHCTAYPGPILGHAMETVLVRSPAAGRGCFQGSGTTNSQAGGGQYFSLSNLSMSCVSTSSTTDACPVNLQTGANFWRIVGCDLTWPSTDTGGAHQKAGGIAGDGTSAVLLGNYVHDISGGDASSLENHGIYLDGNLACAANCEVAYNWVKNVTTGSSIQCHNTVAPDTFTGIKIHHNFCETSAKYGINLDCFTTIDVYNNVVCHTFRNGLRFNPNTSQTGIAVNIEYNTFYDCYQDPTGSYTATISQEASPTSGPIKISHNVVVLSATRTNTAAFINDNGNYCTLAQNLWYDLQGTSSAPAGDATKVVANPLFTAVANNDFTLLAGSPAIDAATGTQLLTVTDDYLGTPRPQGTSRDIGAFEGVGT